MDKSAVRILVLDDEPFMLTLLAHMLAGLGFTSVDTCDNGTAALQWVDDAGDRPNLILFDLNMPKMDGLEFVRKLVEHGYSGSLILVSGEAERVLQMTVRLVRAHEIAVLGHLRKPVSLEGLAALVNTWTPDQTIRSAAKTYDTDELRAALIDGHVGNFYQPKVSVVTGDVVGVEALARWHHPVDGVVLPEQFVGIAEESGLIDELTRISLTQAMIQCRNWQRQGLPLRMAVNISMANLSSVAFADFIAEAAHAAGMEPTELVLELTESRLLLDQRAPLEILARLRLKGFRLSIDDFGTGNSSLTQLRDIAFNELKIDRDFVHGAWRDPTARAMFDASLDLGKRLGMEVVAEGVEDRDDWDMVRTTGCDLAQGYFIAPPMAAGDIPDWVQAWNERASEFVQA